MSLTNKCIQLLGILLVFSCLACSEVVDLKSDRGPKQIIIYGRVTDGIAGNEVNISLTSSFNGREEPVSGARVMLLENEIPVAQYREDVLGHYMLDYRGDSAREGRDYALSVVLADGTQYLSQSATMQSQAARDIPRFDASVVDVQVNQAGLTQERNLIELYVDSEVIDEERDYFLKWDILETYSFQERIRITPIPPPPCYVTNNITGPSVRLFDGSELKVPLIRDQLLVSTEIDSRFAFDYYFAVIQSTMNEQTHDYWNRIDQISNLQGSIFDQAAGAVKGNLFNPNDATEEVLGYFEVLRSDTTHIRIRADEIDFFIQPPCPHSTRDTEPPECTFCQLLKNSTISRPYFFSN